MPTVSKTLLENLYTGTARIVMPPEISPTRLAEKKLVASQSPISILWTLLLAMDRIAIDARKPAYKPPLPSRIYRLFLRISDMVKVFPMASALSKKANN